MRLILLLIAHQLGDYIFQPASMLRWKARSIFGLVVHSLVYSLCVGIAATLWRPTWWVLLGFGAVFLSHLLIDLTRMHIDNRIRTGKSESVHRFALFIADQFLHMAVLFVFARLLPRESIFLLPVSARLGFTASIRGLFVAFGFITVTTPAAVFIKHLLGVCERKSGVCFKDSEPVNNAGMIIGILERLLVFPLCLLNQYGAIGFVLAAKSLARFKEFENRDFAERYIIGTLASIGLVILLAFCYQLLP